MKTMCYSYTDTCPCVLCDRNCCIDSSDENDFTDTEKLCEIAREHCERCANEYKQKVGGKHE